MLVLLGAHAAAAVLAVPVVRRWGSRGVLVTAVAPVAVLVWLVARWARHGPAVDQRSALEWVPGLGVQVALRLDPLAAVMVLVVAGVGALLLGYFAGASHAGRLAGRAWEA